MSILVKQDYRLDSCLLREKNIPAPGFCKLTFYAPSIAAEAKPGQFVMVHVPSSEGRFMLPRPYSIYSIYPGKKEVTIFFEVAGRGGELLRAAEVGTNIRILGPLGSGFPEPPAGSLLVAGGMGIAPLIHLASRTDEPKTLIYGSRTASRLVCPAQDLALPGLTLVEVTEDGSRGERGSACDVARKYLADSSALFACGPRQMLASLSRLAITAGIPAWISVEERMACGIGACLGCVVKTDHGYMRVCKDGPVFKAGEVNLDDDHDECECEPGRH